MPIPDFQAIMLPLLKYAGDDQEHFIHDAIEVLAQEFNLTEEEAKELLPSGAQSIFPNRVGWARSYLKKAGLLDTTKRGYFKITELGKDTLKNSIDKIDIKFLKQFSDFTLTARKTSNPESVGGNSGEDEKQTPREQIENGYKKIRDNLVQELINEIKKSTPAFFEWLVV